ncbi:MAG: TraR/DksA family transcriptional regulator [Phycisphaeraceae bacterium]|nr:TraR/DksA family transcriptional regulator [Phycisphaeraceae bacterium]MBX3407805.1 TraR/DksA family transcriptional regulator [Phycisphaeraceae bacterium]
MAKAASKAKKVSKPPAKPAAKSAKAAAKKQPPKKASKSVKPPPAKSVPAKKPAPAPAAKSTPSKAAAPAKPGASEGDAKKVAPKGITVVTPKVVKKAKPKPKVVMPVAEPLLKPGGKWKPLIPSGPKAPPTPTFGGPLLPEDGSKPQKFKLPKRELDKYREILLRKRSELVGDVNNMEEEALRQNSGSLSSLPQHMAEQGSDASDQALSLDLAQVDRNLIREIDEALKRIDAGTYGVCEITGKPISAERLAELPWARYSIEAARELERRSYRS